MRFEGTLKTWNDERGFGFIAPTQGGQEIFVHIKAFTSRSGRPEINQLLTFEVEIGPQGKKQAKNVAPVRSSQRRASRKSDSPAQWGTATLFTIPAFALLYMAVAIMWSVPRLYIAVYVGASLITFLAYALDKAAAARGAWRTPENNLHLLALVGGWPGALLAQQFFRHKSNKAVFRSIFWSTVIINVIGFVLICSPLATSVRQF